MKIAIIVTVLNVAFEEKNGTFGRGGGRPVGSFGSFWYTSANTTHKLYRYEPLYYICDLYITYYSWC